MRKILNSDDYRRVCENLRELLGDDVALAIIDLDHAKSDDEWESTPETRRAVFAATRKCAAVGIPGFTLEPNAEAGPEAMDSVVDDLLDEDLTAQVQELVEGFDYVQRTDIQAALLMVNATAKRPEHGMASRLHALGLAFEDCDIWHRTHAGAEFCRLVAQDKGS